MDSDFDEEDEDEEQLTASGLFGREDLDNIDLDATNRFLEQSVDRLRDLAQTVGAQLRSDIESSDETNDRRVFDDELDNLLRDEETVHEIADALMDEICPRTNVWRTKSNSPVRPRATFAGLLNEPSRAESSSAFRSSQTTLGLPTRRNSEAPAKYGVFA